MKRFLKRNKLLLLSLVLLFALAGGSTYALLTATANKIVNTFSLANIDTKITEETGDFGYKVVKVQNVASSPVYVRAKVLVSGGEVGATAVEFVTSESTPTGAAINVVYNANNWEKSGDWFYYKGVLHKDETTPALITRVLVGDGVDTSKSFEVDVYQESVLTNATTWTIGNAQAAFG